MGGSSAGTGYATQVPLNLLDQDNPATLLVDETPIHYVNGVVGGITTESRRSHDHPILRDRFFRRYQAAPAGGERRSFVQYDFSESYGGIDGNV
jgi:hypothetical protein